MKIEIDPKSAALGIIVGVFAMFAMGAGTNNSNDTGRYKVSVGASMAVMVDTKTGQAWQDPLPGVNTRTDANFFDPK